MHIKQTRQYADFSSSETPDEFPSYKTNYNKL